MVGDLKKSILINQKRFGFSEEMAFIFLNTVELFEGEESLVRGDIE